MKMYEEMLRTRRLFIFNDIDQNIVGRLIELIGAMSLAGATDAELVIDSSGGSNEAALHLYDVIKGSGIRFRGLVMAKCMSSAVTVLQACEVRHAMPHARFLVHGLTRRLEHVLSADSSLEKIIKMLTEAYDRIKLAESNHKKIIRLRLKDQKKFDEFYKSDEVFCAYTALDIGLIDKVVTQA